MSKALCIDQTVWLDRDQLLIMSTYIIIPISNVTSLNLN